MSKRGEKSSTSKPTRLSCSSVKETETRGLRLWKEVSGHLAVAENGFRGSVLPKSPQHGEDSRVDNNSI